MIIGNIKCCTLAHNFKGDVIEHDYYGTNRVVEDLQKFKSFESGIIEIDDSNIIRDKNTNWVIGITQSKQV